MKITRERAIEILNPEHAENYEDIEIVNEACRMGAEALKAQAHGKWQKKIKGSIVGAACENCGKFYAHSARRAIYREDEAERLEKFHMDIFCKDYKYCPNCGAKMEGAENG